MKKAIRLIIAVIFLTVFLMPYGPATAYVPLEYINDIPVKFYNQDLKTNCSLILQNIPPTYFKGLRGLYFFERPGRYAGLYFWNSKLIHVYDGCNKDTIIHELAHHKNHMDGDSYFISGMHKEIFKLAEVAIWTSS